MTDEATPPPGARQPPAPSPVDAGRSQRRRAAALAGHEGNEARARQLLGDDDADVRATALRALARVGLLTPADLQRAAEDPAPAARRGAADIIATDDRNLSLADGVVPHLLASLLDDADPAVVEITAWAAGEWIGRMLEAGLAPPTPDLVTRLSRVTIDHPDALCREAAVAALGAIGDDATLDTILAATHDKATVRRRAVIALAPFDGDEVTAALERARADRDWQVRQAAEDLLADSDLGHEERTHDDRTSGGDGDGLA